MKYIIGNWKAHKDIFQAVEWAEEFKKLVEGSSELLALLNNNVLKIIICPPFPFIYLLKQFVMKIPNIEIGSQDISQFDEGSYTGEVTASGLRHIISHSIIGHSERRKEVDETEEVILRKVQQLSQYSLQCILCIRNENDLNYQAASFVAYEPINSIGSGHNMNVEDVINMKQRLKLWPEQKFIYGGSVNHQDCQEYFQTEEIDGLLIGKASLDPQELVSIALQTKH